MYPVHDLYSFLWLHSNHIEKLGTVVHVAINLSIFKVTQAFSNMRKDYWHNSWSHIIKQKSLLLIDIFRKKTICFAPYSIPLNGLYISKLLAQSSRSKYTESFYYQKFNRIHMYTHKYMHVHIFKWSALQSRLRIYENISFLILFFHWKQT